MNHQPFTNEERDALVNLVIQTFSTGSLNDAVNDLTEDDPENAPVLFATSRKYSLLINDCADMLADDVYAGILEAITTHPEYLQNKVGY